MGVLNLLKYILVSITQNMNFYSESQINYQAYNNQNQQTIQTNLSMKKMNFFEIKELQSQMKDNHQSIYDSQRNSVIDAEIERKKNQIQTESPEVASKGRGGNNTSQNLKKACLTLFRKYLPKKIQARMKTELIDQFHLKSQKQNIVIFFLYLHEFVLRGQLQQKIVERIITAFFEKIDIFINNSIKRIQDDPARIQFHQKNVKEFVKFKAFQLTFQGQIRLQAISRQLRPLFLKKKVNHAKAVNKIIKVIQFFPGLKSKYVCLSEQQKGSLDTQFSQKPLVNQNLD